MRRVFRLQLGKRSIAREIDDELRFHLETRIERLMAQGVSREDARAEALRQFGDIQAVRDSCMTFDEQRRRAHTRANMLSELRQDLFYAARTLKRNIGVSTVIIGALAIGIGANTAIFTLIDAVLIRTLPIPGADRLVAVGNPALTGGAWQGSVQTDLLSYPLYRDFRKGNPVFSDVLASGNAGRIDVQIDGTNAELEHPNARFVSSNYFSVLGVPSFAGRLLESQMDDVPGSSPVIVISHGYWLRRFQGNRSAIGKQITVNGTKLTIIGVAPPEFTGDVVGYDTDVWLPASIHDVLFPKPGVLADRSWSWLLLLGRLKPGATLAEAKSTVPTLLKREILAGGPAPLAREFAAAEHQYFVSDGSKGFSAVRQTFHAPLITLMMGVVLLLCIICANVANLLLARAVARRREFTVRLALGANRARLVRQLLTESAVIAILSAAAGVIIASWGSGALLALASNGRHIPVRLGLDLTVLAFTLGVSASAVGLFGLAPALRASRVDLASSMRASASSIAGAGGRVGRVPAGALLVTAQVALSVVLLVGAAMLVRSLRNAESTNLGLDRDHLVVVEVDPISRGYEGLSIGPFANRLRDRLAAVPGVADVSFSENGLFSGTESAASIELPGFPMRHSSDSLIAYDQVGAGYARAIGAHLIAGRDIARSDEGVAPRVVIVNESLAKFYFNGGAVGQFLHFSDSIAVQVVGVIADVRDHDLEAKPSRRAYFPYAHAEDPRGLGWPYSLRFEVRTVGAPADMVQALRQAIRAVDPSLPIDGINPLSNLMRGSISQERLLAQLATAFGVLALALAAIGLYGVMTYAITRRTSEIGLRVALGAQRANVIRMVVLDSIRLVGAGVIIGVPLALAAARLLRTQLYDVSLVDPASVALAVVVLLATAIIAGVLPARRAAGVSPIVALRAE